MMVGGFSANQAISDDDRALLLQVRPQVEEEAGEQFGEFEPLQVSKQIVAGTNYWFKVQVGDERFVHVKVFVPLPHTGSPPAVHQLDKDVSRTAPFF